MSSKVSLAVPGNTDLFLYGFYLFIYLYLVMLIMLYSKVTELVYSSLSTQKRISIRSKGEKVLVSIRETGWFSSDLSHREVLPILRLIYMFYLYIYKFGYQEERHEHSRLINCCSKHRYSRKCDSSKGNNNLMSLLMLMEASERS